MKRLKIHYTLILFLITSILSGIIKEVLLMYLILLFHELGHLFIIKKYHYEITKIELLPFGAVIECNLANKSLKEEFLLYISGLTINFIFLLILVISKNFNVLFYLNLTMLIFNLLPVMPLDGGRIFEVIIASTIKYKKALLISIIFSSICLGAFFLYFSFFFRNLNIILIFSYLLLENYINIKSYKKKYNLFLLAKYLYPNKKLNEKKIKPKHNELCANLYKGKNTTLVLDNKEITEEKILKHHFNAKSR